MLIRLYLDEDSMSDALIATLRTLGVDVLSALEANLISAADEEQLAFAAAQRRCLYSYNVRDFYRLHYECLQGGNSHAGIILCQQQQFSVGEQSRRIERLAAALSAQEMTDRVEFLGAWG
jgi:hypothetical protein